MYAWALLIGSAINDPQPIEIARFSTRAECIRAEAAIALKGKEHFTEEELKTKPVDVYGMCREIKRPGVPG